MRQLRRLRRLRWRVSGTVCVIRYPRTCIDPQLIHLHLVVIHPRQSDKHLPSVFVAYLRVSPAPLAATMARSFAIEKRSRALLVALIIMVMMCM